MTESRIICDGLSGAISKLDSHFAGSEITEITLLQQQEVTLKLANLTSKDVRTLVFGKKEWIVEDIGKPTSVIVSKNFMIGDVILKVNGKPLDPRSHINNMLTAKNNTTVVLKRRAYATVPDETRLRNTLIDISCPRLKGFAYQVVTCNKNLVRQEKLMKSTFGFLAVNLSGKFVVVKISEHSAAEKFFAIGDALLDLNGRSLRPSDKDRDLQLINPAFQKTGEISILIERAVTSKARREACNLMKEYLATPCTEPAMADDAVFIGRKAARYHNDLWKRLEPISILVGGGHKASPKKRSSNKSKKKTKGEDKEKGGDEGADQSAHHSGTSTAPISRVTIDPKRNSVEIQSDVENMADLEAVGSRFTDDLADKDDKKKLKKNNSLLYGIFFNN